MRIQIRGLHAAWVLFLALVSVGCSIQLAQGDRSGTPLASASAAADPTAAAHPDAPLAWRIYSAPYADESQRNTLSPASVVVYRDGLVAVEGDEGVVGIQLSPAELDQVERRLRAAAMEPSPLYGFEPCCDQPVTILRVALDAQIVEAATYGISLYEFVTPTAAPGGVDPGRQYSHVNRFPQGMPEVDLILDQLRDRVLAGPSEPVERPMPVIPILPITQS